MTTFAVAERNPATNGDAEVEFIPERLEQDLRRSLFELAPASSRSVRIGVDISRRTVTLSGTVPSFHLRQVFCHACRHLAAGYRVDDHLRVAPSNPLIGTLVRRGAEA